MGGSSDEGLERRKGRPVGEPVVKADGQAFRFDKNAVQAGRLPSQLPRDAPKHGNQRQRPRMSKSPSPPTDLEPMTAGVRDGRDADEPFEVVETPPRDDPHASPRVAGEAGEDPAGFLRKANGLRTIHDRREGAVEIREENEPAASPEGFLQVAAEGHGSSARVRPPRPRPDPRKAG